MVTSFTDNFQTSGICALLALVGLFITAVLYIKNVNGAILLGIVAMAVLVLASSLLLGARWGDPLGVALLILAAVFRSLGHTWTFGAYDLWALPVTGILLILVGRWVMA